MVWRRASERVHAIVGNTCKDWIVGSVVHNTAQVGSNIFFTRNTQQVTNAQGVGQFFPFSRISCINQIARHYFAGGTQNSIRLFQIIQDSVVNFFLCIVFRVVDTFFCFDRLGVRNVAVSVRCQGKHPGAHHQCDTFVVLLVFFLALDNDVVDIAHVVVHIVPDIIQFTPEVAVFIYKLVFCGVLNDDIADAPGFTQNGTDHVALDLWEQQPGIHGSWCIRVIVDVIKILGTTGRECQETTKDQRFYSCIFH